MSVCLFVWSQNSSKVSESMNISTLKVLPANFKSYKDQNKNRLLLKPLCLKVMTIFVTHGRHFTTFRRCLVAKEFTETQLILFLHVFPAEHFFCFTFKVLFIKFIQYFVELHVLFSVLVWFEVCYYVTGSDKTWLIA